MAETRSGSSEMAGQEFLKALEHYLKDPREETNDAMAKRFGDYLESLKFEKGGTRFNGLVATIKQLKDSMRVPPGGGP